MDKAIALSSAVTDAGYQVLQISQVLPGFIRKKAVCVKFQESLRVNALLTATLVQSFFEILVDPILRLSSNKPNEERP